MQLVIALAARVTGLSYARIQSIRRDQDTMTARLFVIGVARRRGISSQVIGRSLNRDHSTVIYGWRKYKQYYNEDADFRRKAEKIRTALDDFLTATTTYTMAKKIPTFAPEPPLWPDSFTDLFRIDLNADLVYLDCVEHAASETGDPYYWDEPGRFLMTSSQMFVDALKEQLYGAEVAYEHLHIPEHYG